jgi:outer membrane protein OmpA-like peptidoglycan-associated protein
MKQIALLTNCLLLITVLTAQTNLVPNPSFEEVEGKLKQGGQVDLAAPWRSITMNPVDLYSAETKDDEYGVPENKYGAEKARTGNNYAGVSFFGYRGRLPRTYLGTQLIKPLEAGKEYCFKFHVSLADRSKYAVNNLGLYVTKDSIVEMSESNLSFTPQIKSITNRIFEQQYLWEAICGTYKAEGGEQFIIIGNFNSDDETDQETLRMSREFSGRQNYDAYYFIDDVTVTPKDELGEKDCICDKIAGGNLEVEYKSFGSDKEESKKANKTYIVNSDGSQADATIAKGNAMDSEKLEGGMEEAAQEYSPGNVEIFFDSKAFEPKAAENNKLENLGEYLRENPTVNVEIVGHEDPSEADENILSRRRAFYIKSQLVGQGVAKERLTIASKGTEQPKAKGKPEMNQRVTFVIK